METITIKSDRPMVILPMEEYEGMRETLGLLAHNHNLVQELKEERKRMEQGECISYKEFKEKYKVK